MKSIWGPKSVQNEVGNRVGKVIGKRRAKEGVMRASMGSQMGLCWAENRGKLGSKSSMEKRSVKTVLRNLILESSLGRGPAVSLWLKPKAAPKNGGTEDWRTVAASLTRHRPEAWRILHGLVQGSWDIYVACIVQHTKKKGTSWVPAGSSWYQVEPVGTRWYELAPVGTSCFQVVPDKKTPPWSAHPAR